MCVCGHMNIMTIAVWAPKNLSKSAPLIHNTHMHKLYTHFMECHVV